MIDLTLVSDELREIIEDSESFDVDTWRMVSADWHPGTCAAARLFRKMGEPVRAMRLRENPQGISDLAASGDPGTELWMQLFCLSDAALDRLISTFPDN